MSVEAGNDARQVFVQAISGGERRWRVSTAGGTQPQWRADGRELYFMAPDGLLMAAAVGASPDFTVDTPVPLFRAPVTKNPFFFRNTYQANADGTRFLVNEITVEAGAEPITVMSNWAQSLAR
jgi:hypothetical protein